VRRLVPALALPVLCSVALLAQSPAPPAPGNQAAAGTASTTLPEAGEVLARYVAALGGQAALSKLNSRVMKGTFEIPAQNMSGSAEIDMQAPDHFFSEISIPDGGEHILVFDGKTGWSAEPQSGVHRISGLELDQLQRSSQFLYESRLRELFTNIRVVGKIMEENRSAWVVQAAPAQGYPELFYFDVDSGLLLRHDSIVATSDGNVLSEHRYSHYVTVDGVEVPSLLRHHDAHFDWQVKFTEIRQNVPIDSSKFAKPSAHQPAHK